MTLETQFSLKSNPIYIDYLHSHSYWYKLLTREPSLLNEFINEAKKYYQVRPMDKINKALNTITLLQNILETIK